MPEHPELLRPRHVTLGVLLILLALFATACGPAPRPPVATGVATPQASSTPQITIVAATGTTLDTASASATNTLEVTTSTPQPPAATATAASTVTPSATDTPAQAATAVVSPTQGVLDYTWTRLALTGTSLTSMSLLPGGGNTVLVAGPNGVWTGSYNYTQWISHTVKLAGQAVAVSIADPDVMYVASHTGCASGLPINDSRSADGGKTWQEIPGLNAIAIVPASGAEAYAATCSSVQKTTDAGLSWAKLPKLIVPNYDPTSIAVSPDGKTLFVAFTSEGGTGRILRSTDGGNSVTDVTPKVAAGQEFVAPANLTLVQGSEGRPQEGGLYMTSYEGVWFLPDESNDWKLLNKPVSADNANANYSWFTTLFVDTAYSADYNKPGAVLYTAMAKPGDTGLSNLGVFRSIDEGKTWEMFGKGLEGKAINSIVLAPHDPAALPGMVETLLAATNDGVWAVPLPPPFR